MKLITYTDGGARGNPGPAAAGIVIKNEKGEVVMAFGEFLGKQTNNFAEYSALLLALKKVKELGASEVECILDSELVAKQMKGEYKIRDLDLQKLFVQVYNTAAQFKKVKYRHVLREKNKEADDQVNKILDKPENSG